MPYAEIHDQRLFVEDTGGDGPPVVFSHGFLLDHTVFAHQVAELRDVYRLITWDARDLGRSDGDGRPFSLWDAADDLFGILDIIGVERAVLVGTGQGGGIGLRAALRHPDRVRALVLMNTPVGPEPVERQRVRRELLDAWTAHGRFEDLPEDVQRDLARSFLGGSELETAWLARWRELDGSRVAQAGRAMLGRDDLGDRLDELAMPVLVVHAAGGDAPPQGSAHALCDAVSDCRGVVEVAGGGPLACQLHPRVVTSAIRGFLEGLPA